MAKITSLHGTNPAEIFESGLQNIDDIDAVAAVVLWKDGRVSAGWSNVGLPYLTLMVATLDEKQRQALHEQLEE